MSQDAQAYIGDVTTQLDEGLGEIVKENYESLVNTNFRWGKTPFRDTISTFAAVMYTFLVGYDDLMDREGKTYPTELSYGVVWWNKVVVVQNGTNANTYFKQKQFKSI